MGPNDRRPGPPSRPRRGAAPLLAASVAALLVPAGEPLAAHPLATDDTTTQGQGRFQVELTGEVGRDREATGGVEVRAAGAEIAVVLTAGVLDRLDVAVGVRSLWIRVDQQGAPVSDELGLGDLGLEAKWRVLQIGGFALALKPGLALPTGDARRKLGTGRVGYLATLAADQALGTVTLHANVGYARTDYSLAEDRAANRRDGVLVSVAATAQVAGALQLAGEVGARRNPARGERTWPVFALGGAVYTMGEDLDLSLGVRVGVTRPEIDLAALAGVTIRF
jgi:hypothetical protein